MTLFTSDKHRLAKYTLAYIAVSAFCSVFGAVYEHFSYEVWSVFMIYSFTVPLMLGAFPLAVLLVSRRRLPDRTVINLQASGIAALTVGCIYKGMLEIYGTENSLSVVYWIVGGAFMLASYLAYRFKPRLSAKKDSLKQMN